MLRALVIAVAALLLLPLSPVLADSPLDWAIDGGHFYTEANGQGGAGGTGFSVVDDASANFWSEFQRLGGIDVLGYPISRRFTWDGFTVQAFQKAILQWHPENGQAAFLNVFDRLSQAGKDDWLEAARSTPASFDNSADATLSWSDVVARHLALLDANPAIKARYLADADPILHYGLPMAYKSYGNVFVVRAQRAVLQQWLTAVPWAAAGQVVVANGGDNAKDAGVLPPQAIEPEPSVSPEGGNARFGVIGPAALVAALPRLGATWWYDWGQVAPDPTQHRVGQISLRPQHGDVVRVAASTLADGARQDPGGYWLIGNEPNVPGQDEISPDAYAVELKYYVDTIKGADPTAKIVAPNVLNFDATCSGCTGMTAGRAWVDAFRAAWANRYGGEPSIDVWGIHAYTISWDKLPMTDVTATEAQVSAFSDYLAAVPALAARPIWLSEFGVVWGFDGYTNVSAGCAAAPNCIAPTGPFDQAAVGDYLDHVLTWLTSNDSRYRIDRWFVYTTFGNPEPFATAYGGVSLLSANAPTAPLSPLGAIYQRHATP
jgi:hypothetical protein